MSIFEKLLNVITKKGAAFVILIDPDRKDLNSITERVESANEAGADALFIGGSLMMDSKCAERVKKIKSISKLPIIFFPGGVGQLNQYYDAMLFMSVISGRNPHYLIGEQVIAAPLVKDLGLEVIPTGYILIDGGSASAVEIMSGTRPIPMERVDIAVAHALAGQYLGMKLIYLEAGSGAEQPVSNKIISSVSKAIDLPIVVGGGIIYPRLAEKAVKSGASIVVVGNKFENDLNFIKEFASAIHKRL